MMRAVLGTPSCGQIGQPLLLWTQYEPSTPVRAGKMCYTISGGEIFFRWFSRGRRSSRARRTAWDLVTVTLTRHQTVGKSILRPRAGATGRTWVRTPQNLVSKYCTSRFNPDRTGPDRTGPLTAYRGIVLDPAAGRVAQWTGVEVARRDEGREAQDEREKREKDSPEQPRHLSASEVHSGSLKSPLRIRSRCLE